MSAYNSQVKINSPLTRLLAKRRGERSPAHPTTPTTPVRNMVISPTSNKQIRESDSLVNMLHDGFVERSSSLRSHLMDELRCELGVMRTTRTSPLQKTNYLHQLGDFKSNRHEFLQETNAGAKDIDADTNTVSPAGAATVIQLQDHIHHLELERDQSHIQVELEAKRADDAVLQAQTLRNQVTALHDNIAQMRLAAVELEGQTRESMAEKHAHHVEKVRKQSSTQVFTVQEELQRHKQTHQQTLESRAALKKNNASLTKRLQSNEGKMKSLTSQRETARAKLEVAEQRAMSAEQKSTAAYKDIKSLESTLHEKVVLMRALEDKAAEIEKKEAAGLLLSKVDVDIVRQEADARLRMLENQLRVERGQRIEESLLLEATKARATKAEIKVEEMEQKKTASALDIGRLQSSLKEKEEAALLLMRRLSDSNAHLESSDTELLRMDEERTRTMDLMLKTSQKQQKEQESMTHERDLLRQHCSTLEQKLATTSGLQERVAALDRTVATLMKSLAKSEDRGERKQRVLSMLRQELATTSKSMQLQEQQQQQQQSRSGSVGETVEMAANLGVDEEEGEREGEFTTNEDLVPRLRSLLYEMSSSTRTLIDAAISGHDLKMKENKHLHGLQMKDMHEARALEMSTFKERLAANFQAMLASKESTHFTAISLLKDQLVDAEKSYATRVQLSEATKSELLKANTEKEHSLHVLQEEMETLGRKTREERARVDEALHNNGELKMQLRLASEMETELQATLDEKENECELAHEGTL
jgi:hypothetical protein